MKDKARLYQVQRHEQPERIMVKLSELEERVGNIHQIIETSYSPLLLQAKEHDIFDISPFLRSKLFSTNGYMVVDKIIEKHFRTD